jgi:hypothetical protein
VVVIKYHVIKAHDGAPQFLDLGSRREVDISVRYFPIYIFVLQVTIPLNVYITILCIMFLLGSVHVQFTTTTIRAELIWF